MTLKDNMVQYYVLKLLLIITRRLLYKGFTVGEDRDDVLIVSKVNTFLMDEFERGWVK